MNRSQRSEVRNRRNHMMGAGRWAAGFRVQGSGKRIEYSADLGGKRRFLNLEPSTQPADAVEQEALS